MSVLTVATCAVMAGCGGAPDGDHGSPALKSTQFQAEGRAVELSKTGQGETTEPIAEIPGSPGLGSIRLKLSSSRTTSKKCSLTPPGVVAMSYTATTSFEPADLTRHESFPESLRGRILNIRGKVFEVGQSCLPVAMTVQDVGGSPPETAVSAGEGLEDQSTQFKEAISRPKREKPAASKRSSDGSSAVALPPVPAPSPLPPSAPEVVSTFRPSLPDPPAG
ncbi:MAG TPA: hypothetical protein VHJ40_04840 [Actinomycetota bacterium]|nr:hypothetical protein [Actinomycetota bacterium]